MEEPLVSKELAILIKGIGFNEECRKYYDEDLKDPNAHVLMYYEGDSSGVAKNSEIGKNFLFGMDEAIATAPSLSLVQKWFREVHDMVIEVSIVQRKSNAEYYWRVINKSIDGPRTTWNTAAKNSGYFDSYGEALESGLREAVIIFTYEKIRQNQNS